MNFFIRHREWFKGMSIASFLSLNFFMIISCYTGEDGAWIATFAIAALAILCSLVCQFTQDLTQANKAASEQNTYNEKIETNEL